MAFKIRESVDKSSPVGLSVWHTKTHQETGAVPMFRFTWLSCIDDSTLNHISFIYLDTDRGYVVGRLGVV